MKTKPVFVEWLDIFGIDCPELKEHEVDRIRPATMHSLMWLIKRDKKFVVFGNNLIHDDSGEYWRNLIAIPKGCISQIINITEPTKKKDEKLHEAEK